MRNKARACQSAPAIPSSTKSVVLEVEESDEEEVESRKSEKSSARMSAKPSIEARAKTSLASNGRVSTKTSKSLAHRHCVTIDNYPCCDQDSDVAESDEDNRDSKSAASRDELKAKQASRCSKVDPYGCEPKQRGFLSKCCPCCFKRPVSRPAFERIDDSRPSSANHGKKMTQTCPDDFKRAKKCFEAQLKEEKRLQKMYGKSGAIRDTMKCADERCKSINGELDDCEDPATKEKRELAYKKARQEYRIKRKKMEAKLTKALEKELEKRGQCQALCSQL